MEWWWSLKKGKEGDEDGHKTNLEDVTEYEDNDENDKIFNNEPAKGKILQLKNWKQ